MEKAGGYAAVLALALGAAGCGSMDLFAVEVEASEICVRGMQVSLAVDETGRVAYEMVEDDLGMEIDDRLEADVRVLSMELSAVDGVDDLAHLVSLDVDLTQPQHELTPVSIVDYQHDGTPAPALFIEAAREVNVVDYVRTGSLAMNLELASDMEPGTVFTVGLDMCFSGAGAFRQKL